MILKSITKIISFGHHNMEFLKFLLIFIIIMNNFIDNNNFLIVVVYNAVVDLFTFPALKNTLLLPNLNSLLLTPTARNKAAQKVRGSSLASF